MTLLSAHQHDARQALLCTVARNSRRGAVPFACPRFPTLKATMSQSARAAMAQRVIVQRTEQASSSAYYRVTPARVARIRREAEERGVRIVELRNGAVRLLGHNVDVMTSDLGLVNHSDLLPVSHQMALATMHSLRGQRRSTTTS